MSEHDVTDHGRVARPWSVSQSHAMAECPRAWWFRYVAKAAPAQPRPVKQLIGSAIHVGLEAVYRAVRDDEPSVSAHRGQALSQAAGLQALTAFNDYWTANGAGVREYERDDAERLLIELLDNLVTPMPASVLGVEQKFTLHTVGTDEIPSAVITGVMDVVFNTSSRLPGSIHIRDWKLGTVPTNPAELENNVQLCTYTAAATYLWPWVKRVTVGLFSIREQREVRAELHPDSVRHARQQLAHDAETARIRAERNWVEPTPGDHCGGCRFRSYCPTMTRAKPPIVPGVDVAAERARIATLLKS